MNSRTTLQSSSTGIAYTCLACVLTWPLPLQLRGSLLGPVTADLGVYIWNFWIFRHELLRHHHLPFSTAHLFAYSGPADFALHNYAPVAGLFGVPLIPLLGLVGAFNLVLVAAIAASGWATFLLARRLGAGWMAAWTAGALFMAAPALVARQTAHFSLIIAAPLPLFLWALLRTLDTRRVRDAILTGLMVALASYSDAYYGIYCVLMGAFVVAWRVATVEQRPRKSPVAATVRLLDAVIAGLLVLMIWRIASGTDALVIGSVRVSLRTLYSPALALVVLAAVRVWIRGRPSVRLVLPLSELASLAGLGVVAIAACTAAMLPVLLQVLWRIVHHRLPETVTYWRSSSRGVDLLAYLVPNPNHPWIAGRTAGWFISEWADAFPEFVSSFSLVALAVIGVGAWRRTLPSLWIGFTACFFALSLGPFVHVAGVNTYVIGPWALLRYVPLLEMVHAPARFAIVVALGLSLLFAFSLDDILRQLRARRALFRRGFAAAVALLLAAELVPAPRRLYSAEIPAIYQLLRTSGEPQGPLLELPTGILDGIEMIGTFNASSQYFQTLHRRPLIGGYLSRVSRWRKNESMRSPMLRVLFALSAGHAVSTEERSEAIASREAFLARSCMAYVLINRSAASADLQAFAVGALKLTLVHDDATYSLMAPVGAPPCQTEVASR